METTICGRDAVIGRCSYRQNDYCMQLARAACLRTILLYCDMIHEGRNSEARGDVHC
jgi:hypothetical protein